MKDSKDGINYYGFSILETDICCEISGSFMRQIIFLGLFTVLIFMACGLSDNKITVAEPYNNSKNETGTAMPDNSKPFILVELFTSEG